MTERVVQVGGGRLGGDVSHPADGNVWAVGTGAGVLLVEAGTGFDPDRLAARHFRWKLEEAGYAVAADFARAGEPGGERTKGTLYRIRGA